VSSQAFAVHPRFARRAGSAAAVLAVAAALAFTAPATAHAVPSTTLYVDQSGTASTGCTSPGTSACTTISDAVTAAEALSTDVRIDVAASPTSYDENVVIDDFNNPTLTIAGAGASTTTLDGGSAGADVTISEGIVTITGMTLTDGDSTDGGAVDDADAVTLTDDVLTSNHASDGAGVYDTAARP
jgi:pectin methylesterase-like acyl-CoA thioesterase